MGLEMILIISLSTFCFVILVLFIIFCCKWRANAKKEKEEVGATIYASSDQDNLLNANNINSDI
jgi:heme/copper-type cytochrome/quinol oxidase subunit 2